MVSIQEAAEFLEVAAQNTSFFAELKSMINTDNQAEITIRDRLNRFEIAQETIGFMMALRTEAIHNEEQKLVPDAAKIAQWNAEFEQLDGKLYGLRLNDDVAIQCVLDEYCPIVKAEYKRSCVGA